MAERISDADNRKARFAVGTTGGAPSSGGYGKMQSNVSKNVAEQRGESSSSVLVGSRPSGALMTHNAYRPDAGSGNALGEMMQAIGHPHGRVVLHVEGLIAKMNARKGSHPECMQCMVMQGKVNTLMRSK